MNKLSVNNKAIDTILVLDFGSQYTHLIGRKIRELGVYAEIYPPKYLNNVTNILNHSVLILSGGPDSVLNKNAPKIDIPLDQIPIPILGICYGFQYISKEFDGVIEKSNQREYGKTIIKISKCDLFKNTNSEQQVWMSHGDSLTKIPKGFKILAKTKKGYGMGKAGESKMTNHQQKELNLDALKEFRDRFQLDIPDNKIENLEFYKPSDDSDEIKYLKKRRDILGGPLPKRSFKKVELKTPNIEKHSKEEFTEMLLEQ